MNGKTYFVCTVAEIPGRQALYEVDVRDIILMLTEKMGRGREGATPLPAEIPLRRVTLAGEKITFSGEADVIECTLVAAFRSFTRAEECYKSEDLKPADARWLVDTIEVLEQFQGAPNARCAFGPAVVFVSVHAG